MLNATLQPISKWYQSRQRSFNYIRSQGTHAVAMALMVLVAVAGHTKIAIASPEAIEMVAQYHAALSKAVDMPAKSKPEEKYRAFAMAMDTAFDFTKMAQIVIGRHWDESSISEKDAFLSAFRQSNVRIAMDRFKDAHGLFFNIGESLPGPNKTKLVTGSVQSKDQTTSLIYVLYDTDDGLKIIDVLLNGSISELALRSSEYSSTLNSGGLPLLTERLQQSIE